MHLPPSCIPSSSGCISSTLTNIHVHLSLACSVVRVLLTETVLTRQVCLAWLHGSDTVPTMDNLGERPTSNSEDCLYSRKR